MATPISTTDSGLGRPFARLGSMFLGGLSKRVAPSCAVQDSGPTVKVVPYTNITTPLKKRVLARTNISSVTDSGIPARIVRVVPYTEIATPYSARFLTSTSINPAAKTLDDPRSPFVIVTSNNEPDEDDGAVQFKVGGVNLTEIPYQFVLNLQESQAAQWSLNIIDMFGKYSPLRVDGPFKDLLDERPFGAAGISTGYTPGVGIQHPSTMNLAAANSDSPYGGQQQTNVNQYVTQLSLDIVKELEVNAKIGGKNWSYRGVGTAFAHTRDWQSKVFQFVWKGNDRSILLNRDNQNMQTIRSGVRNGYGMSMAGAVREICQKYGVRTNLSNILADDFPIPYMNRVQGSPYDWVTQLLSTLCFEWKMKDGIVFTPYLPPLGTTNLTPNFVHDFSKMAVMQETIEGSMQQMYNQIIATRAGQGGTKEYSVDLFEFGDGYSVSFDPPLSAVRHHMDYQNNGFVYNIEYYKGETLIAVHEVQQGSLTYGFNTINSGIVAGATSAKFTWAVLPGGFIGLGSPGRVTFKGVEEPEASVWGGPMFGSAIDQGPADPAPMLRAFAEDLGSIRAYGLRPFQMSASSLIPTQAVLQKFCQRMLLKMSRQARRGTYKIPLNPFIEPGSIIQEIDYSLGALADPFANPLVRTRIVNSCSHSFSNNPEQRYTTYSGTEYITTT